MKSGVRSWRATIALMVAPVLLVTPAVVIPTVDAGDGTAHSVFSGLFARAVDEPSITKTKWLSPRHVALWINSPSMKCVRQVQLLLPRGYREDSATSYPVLYMLDGMRAATNVNGWLKHTNLQKKVEDAPFIVALPIGGAASFYTNWERSPEKNNRMQWEKFLVTELPNLLKKHWRANNSAGVAGLSMGGTAALNLAERHPSVYRFVGSYSGYLDTTSDGMGEAINEAIKEVKPNYDATNMWGPYQNQNWQAHDPKINVGGLRGKTIYVSAGSGNTGPYDKPSSVDGIPEDHTAYMLEILAKMTSTTFVHAAEDAGIPVIANFRNSGTHSWPYWQFEFGQSLPHIKKALGQRTTGKMRSDVEYQRTLAGFAQPAKPKPKPKPLKEAYPVPAPNPKCKPGGDIGLLLKDDPYLAKEAGRCITDEYDVPGGRAQNFERGRVFWSPQTGAHLVKGEINRRYEDIGSSGSFLGMPTSEEQVTAKGVGRWQEFQAGRIYWSADTGAKWVRGTILQEYISRGHGDGPVGLPVSDEEKTRSGAVSRFQHGRIEWSAEDNTAHFIRN